MGRFDHRTFLVTGGTSGIGKAVALAMVREGARVGVCSRRGDVGDPELKGAGIFCWAADVSREEDWKGLMVQVARDLGPLDGLVNCAGQSPRRALVTELEAEAVDRILGVNVKGVLWGLKYGIPALNPQGLKAVVNVASVLGLKGAGLNHGLYVASKHAVVGITREAALEWAPQGVRINGVCPGGVDTPIHKLNSSSEQQRAALVQRHPMGRLAGPEEVAGPILFLLSQEASFITGAMLPVDGGVSAY